MRRQDTRPYRPYQGRRRRHPLRTALCLLVAVCLTVFGSLAAYIGLHSRTRIVGEPKLMVIFGCQIKPDGPSVLLRDRLDAALDYLEEHPGLTVVVAGGKGRDESISEAQGMYDYLTGHGIDGAHIYIEDQSRNTWQNVTCTLALLAEKGYDSTQDVILVSNGFHLSRIRLLWARACGRGLPGGTYAGQQVSTLAAPVSHRPSAVRMFFREPLALAKSLLLDW